MGRASDYPLRSHGKPQRLPVAGPVPLFRDGMSSVSEPVSRGGAVCLMTVGPLVWTFPHL